MIQAPSLERYVAQTVLNHHFQKFPKWSSYTYNICYAIGHSILHVCNTIGLSLPGKLEFLSLEMSELILYV